MRYITHVCVRGEGVHRLTAGGISFAVDVATRSGNDPITNVEGTDNAVKGTDNAVKGTDNAVKGTDNAVEGTDKATLVGYVAAATAFRAQGSAQTRLHRFAIAKDRQCSAALGSVARNHLSPSCASR